jgi:glycosyltransferase involved in cell wall biosynthesis
VTVARGAEPLALILVRNTVSHDARVLREADTLRGLGLEVLIAGVVSTAERERELEVGRTRVVRLDPSAALKRAARRTDHRAPAPRVPSPGVVESEPAPRPPHPPHPPHPLRVPHPPRVPLGGLRRLALTAAYYLQGIALVRRFRPVLVHANDYNTMWIGVAAKLLYGSVVVYDCHELWPDRNGRPEWRPWLVACEALFVRVADSVITASPGYAGEIARRYRVSPPVVVRNVPAAETARRPEGSGLSEASAVYVGGLMPGRGLESAIRALAHVPKLRLRLVGPGSEDYRARLRRCAVESGVADRVELCPAVPPDRVVDTIAATSFGLMLIEPVCLSYELTLPNKLFEYAAAGAPILASDLPVIGALVRSERLGEVAPSDDVERIAQAMRRLLDPVVNERARHRVRAFGARNSWADERTVLRGVYERLLPSRVVA